MKKLVNDVNEVKEKPKTNTRNTAGYTLKTVDMTLVPYVGDASGFWSNLNLFNA